MLHGHRIVVVMPAYRAEKTLAQCHAAIPHDIVDRVLLVDDGSDDATLAVARELGIVAHRHAQNLGYGANQKTCYRVALDDGADIVVLLTEWNEFRALDLGEVRRRMRGALMVDTRNIYPAADPRAAGLNYVSIGRPG